MSRDLSMRVRAYLAAIAAFCALLASMGVQPRSRENEQRTMSLTPINSRASPPRWPRFIEAVGGSLPCTAQSSSPVPAK